MASDRAAPFSLHCTICLDEFNLTDTAPVVLPCGHTYLCEPCSKRLTSCMECRSPLFIAVASRSPSHSSGMSPSAFRHTKYSPASSPHSSECSVKTLSGCNVPASTRLQETIQLPIPKNLVLMAVLEAAKHTVQVEKRQDEDYESGDDDEQVVAGMNLLSSDFGTYVVRDKNGLVVQPLFSSSSDEDESKEAGSATHAPVNVPHVSEQDDDFESFDLQEPFGADGVLPNNPSSLEIPFDETGSGEVVEGRGTNEELPVFRGGETREDLDKKPFILRYGQTVQVVSFVDGKATLARRHGYIEASEKQLVKGSC